MKLATGDVVWHRAPFKDRADGSPPRPWLVVSNQRHPFHGSEYVGLGMTTTERTRAIPVERGDWIDGGLEKPGFVSPWFAMTLKHADITHRIGAVEMAVVDDAVEDLVECLGSSRSRE